jgi:hypothetical protein
MTNVAFTTEEKKLLKMGPKYNMHYHKDNWPQTLALEAETAITKLPSTDHDYFKSQVTNRIEKTP